MADDHLSNTPHPNPPRAEEDRLFRLRLIRSRRVGAVTFHRLLAEYGSAGDALQALPDIARAAGLSSYEPCDARTARAEMARGARLGATALFHGERDYPPALAGLADAPPMLWAWGDTGLLARPMVALIGARNASSLGRRMARRLATGLGEAGFVIVSGLARGIDSEAHAAALPTGTIAVMAGGVDVPYPEENVVMAQNIRRQGLLLSEQPMGMAPLARHFPLRNRIVSGLCRAVIVVEAAARSGSLITARSALDQGREVMAVPGHPFDPRAAGCNALLREGAVLVRDVEDVLEALGGAKGDGGRPVTNQRDAPAPVCHPPVKTVTPRRRPDAPPLPRNETGGCAALRPVAALHQMILDRLGPSPLAEDQLIRDLDLAPADLADGLLTLELEGRILRHPGGLLARL